MKYFSRSILVCHGQLLICLYGVLIVLDGAFQCGHFGYCICLSATLVCWVNGNHLRWFYVDGRGGSELAPWTPRQISHRLQ